MRGLLRELQIPANAERRPDAFERVRQAILYDGTSEAELRAAFGDLGLDGSGSGDKRQALQDIRRALLRNL